MGGCWDIRIRLGSCTLCDASLFSGTGVRTFSNNIDRNPRTHVMLPNFSLLTSCIVIWCKIKHGWLDKWMGNTREKLLLISQKSMCW